MKRRYVDLDGVRAFAAASVVAQHWLPGTSVVRDYIPFGAIGILLFFVLSGFLITDILLEMRPEIERGKLFALEAIRRFYLSRFLRIIPLYALGLAILYVLNVEPTRDIIWWHVGFVSNIYPSQRGGFIPFSGHYWSLAVEWKFYLVWGILVLLAPLRAIPWIIVAPLFVAPMFRFYAPQLAGLKFADLWLPGSMDALAAGGLLAWLKLNGGSERYERFCLFVGLPFLAISWAAVTFKFAAPFNPAAFYFTAFSMLFVWLIGRSIVGWKGPIGWILRSQPIQYLGKISYGIYVYHVAMLGFVPALCILLGIHEIMFPYYNSQLFRATVTVGIAALSWHFYEKPIMDWGRSLGRASMRRPAHTAAAG